MTKGSNLPYRRLCVELGARVLVSEMVVARRLKQRRRGEFALIRRAPDEPCFGVQLAGNQPDEMAWAAMLVESRGVDFVDINLGCPIDHFTRKGLGAALGRQPSRVGRIVEAMRRAVQRPGHRQDSARLERDEPELSRSRAKRPSTPARPPSRCTAARARRGTGIRPTGMRSLKSLPRSACRSSATATCCSPTTSSIGWRLQAARRS